MYRLSEKDYIKSISIKIQTDTKAQLSLYSYPIASSEIENIKGRIQDSIYKKSGNWRFNEFIGFIRLHLLGGQIRGEYFSYSGKRITSTRKKVFHYKTHKLASEISLRYDANNEEIFDKILLYISRCKQELNPKHIIDDEHIRKIGPYVDWTKLLFDCCLTHRLGFPGISDIKRV